MKMKKLVLLIPLLSILWNANSQDISTIKVKGSYKNESLDLVILNLKLNHRLNFEYDPKIVEDISITTSFNKIPLEEALKQIFAKTSIHFEWVEDRTIKLFKKSRKEEIASQQSQFEPQKSNFTASGTIRDQSSGETLPYANLVIKGTNNGVTTNVDGIFTLFNVPSDTSILVVSYIGYQVKEFRLTPDTDIGNINIELEDFSQQLEQVVVRAINEEQMVSASTGVSRIGFSPQAFSKVPSYGEKDIFKSLQLLPGVSGSNESSSGLYVRGGTPDQNLILFDGFTVYHVDHLFGFFSAFNANAVKDVQLYKGGFDSKFGGRLSSVVEMTGKDGNTEEFNMGLGVSLLSFNAFLEAPFSNGKGSFLIAGRRSFQSNFYTNIFDAYTESNEAENGNTAFDFGRRFGQQEVRPNTYFYDLNAKATYRFTEDDVFSISFYNGEDDLDNSSNVDQNAFFNRFGGGSSNLNFDRSSTDLTGWGNWGSSIKWSRKWNDRFYSNLNFSYSNYYSERDRSETTTVVRDDTTTVNNTGRYEHNDLRDFTVKWDNEIKISQKNQFDIGLQSTWNDIQYQFIQNDTNTILNRQDKSFINSLYLQDRHTFSDKWIAKAGLRTTYYGLTGSLYFEPRGNLNYLISDNVKIKAAWGKYYQFANRIVREDIEQGSRDFWLLADDESVPISSALHHILGVSYETNRWLFDIETYYKKLDGLSEYTTRITSSGFGPGQELSYEEFFYTGTGIAQGIEFLAQKKLGQLTGWLSYTLSSVKYNMPAFGETPFFANQDVPHEFKIVSNYKLGKLTFGGTFIYASGKPYTAPTGFYELTLLDGSIADFYELSEKNQLRYENYHRLDLSATYDFNLGSSKANVGLSVTNVYNRKNTWYKEYDVIEGELLETNVSLLGATPSIFFNWTLK